MFKKVRSVSFTDINFLSPLSEFDQEVHMRWFTLVITHTDFEYLKTNVLKHHSFNLVNMSMELVYEVNDAFRIINLN